MIPAESNHDVAVIGMAARFPGAANIDQFWSNLECGVESITFFSDDELLSAGVDPQDVANPHYIKARGIIENIDLFDAEFFGFSPREARMMDPQQRIFLECCYEALNDAACVPEYRGGQIALYAGASKSTYVNYLSDVESERHEEQDPRISLGNDSSYLATRVSYKLNLKGPSFCVQTACSSSLVAIHLAYQSLLTGECDVALAGGVSIDAVQRKGYMYQAEGIASPDGHCRTFDARARGTVGGNGVGVVVLKRVADAIVDGDRIRAVIKGSAINNDGSRKIGYTAPSVYGQAEVISDALAMAEISADTVTYVEAHGTGTAVGDPIETTALTRAFREVTTRNGFCALGSVKTNIGHLDAAAGVAGFIKTVMAIERASLPASLHFEQANPLIDFEHSPFYVNTVLSAWKSEGGPRRAGVSSFGIGGTNAHVLLQEPPTVPSTTPSGGPQILVLSAKSEPALERATGDLAVYLASRPAASLSDIAFTLQVGREAFSHRRALICADVAEAAALLLAGDPACVYTGHIDDEPRALGFMFSGQGTQHVNMARDLYVTELAFRHHVDECCELLGPHLGLDLRDVLYPPLDRREQDVDRLAQTALAQPALFVVEYALAKLWETLGISPQMMIGHSIGEYVAACLAGVFSLPDALLLVATRGRLMQGVPKGTMLAVSLAETELNEFIRSPLSIAAVNAPNQCVVSGPVDAVAAEEQRLKHLGIACRRLPISHAFHSLMMEPIVQSFIDQVSTIQLHTPHIPYISNVTGTWITSAQATDPVYWGLHVRRPVRFAEGLREVVAHRGTVLLEIGPGQTLTALARKQVPHDLPSVFSSMRHSREELNDVVQLFDTLSKLWLAGLQPRWEGLYSRGTPHREPLPPYPFGRQSHWLPTVPPEPAPGKPVASEASKTDLGEWFYTPVWKQSLPVHMTVPMRSIRRSRYLIFMDDGGLGRAMAEQLRREGHDVVSVVTGDRFANFGDRSYALRVSREQDYRALITDLQTRGLMPSIIVHTWATGSPMPAGMDDSTLQAREHRAFYSLVFLTQALAAANVTDPLHLEVISSGVQQVTGQEMLSPHHALILGPCCVIGQEHPTMRCRSIDIELPPPCGQEEQTLVTELIREVSLGASEPVIAYRGLRRWIRSFVHIPLPAVDEGSINLKREGVYLITGGMGNIGLAIAEYLARSVQAKLVLIGRTAVPRDQWAHYLATDDLKAETSSAIRRLQAMENAGSDIMTFPVDVGDRAAMRGMIRRVHERFGRINGVIHSAGLIGDRAFSPITELDQRACEDQFRSKVWGTLVLEEILGGLDLDFCVMQSSISTVLGGVGLCAYAAANAFLDAHVQKLNWAGQRRWITVDWDGWRFQADAPEPGVGGSWTDTGIEPSEGVEALQRLLSIDGLSHTVVSTTNLDARLARWIEPISVKDIDEPVGIQPARATISNQQPSDNASHSPIEREIAATWSQLLGRQQVGVNDNFFALGGDSLLAIQLMARLQETFRVTLPVRSLFEAPSVAGLADAIAREMVGQHDETVEQLLRELDELTEEEVEAILEHGHGELTFEQPYE